MIRPSASVVSRAWEVEKSHGGLYSGGKIDQVRSSGRTVLGLLFEEDVALVDAETGQLLRMLQRTAEEVDDSANRDVVTTFALNPRLPELVTASRNLMLRQWSIDYGFSPPAVQCVRSIKGHQEPIACVDYDPTGVFLATGSVDGSARVFDMRGGFATHNFRGHGGIVSLVRFHPDPLKLLLVTASDDGAARIWSLHDKSCVAMLSGGHMSAVTCVAFSSDGYTMATGSRDKVVNMWELRHHTLLKTLAVYEECEGLAILSPSEPNPEEEPDGQAAKGRSKRKRAFEDASGRLVVVGGKGLARAWRFEAKDHKRIAELSRSGKGGDDLLRCTLEATEPSSRGEPKAYMALARPLDSSQLLVAATADHNLVFLEPGTLRPVRHLVGYNDEITSVVHMGDTGRLAVGTNSPSLKLMRLQDLSCQVLDGHSGAILGVDSCPAGEWVVTASKDRTARLWHVPGGASEANEDGGSCVMVCVGHTQGVTAAAFSKRPSAYASGDAFFFTASGDRTLKKWKVDSRELVGIEAPLKPTAQMNVRAHEKDINHLAVSPNDSLVATCSQDKTVKLWATSDLSLSGTLRGHKRGVLGLAFSPVNKSCATCSGDRTLKVWSLTDLTCLKTLQGHSGSVLALSFLTSGSQLISTGADGLVKVWTLKSNECEVTLDRHSDKVWALSVRGQQMITGGADSLINVWKDVTQAQAEASLVAAEAKVLKEQDLLMSVHRKDFTQAIELAFELGHSYRLWAVLSQVMDDSTSSNSAFDGLVDSWEDARLLQCLDLIKEWNTNATKAHVAQALLSSILRRVPLDRFQKLGPQVASLVAALIPYTERHLARLDRLAQASFVIDYTCAQMSAIGHHDPLPEEHASQIGTAVASENSSETSSSESSNSESEGE